MPVLQQTYKNVIESRQTRIFWLYVSKMSEVNKRFCSYIHLMLERWDILLIYRLFHQKSACWKPLTTIVMSNTLKTVNYRNSRNVCWISSFTIYIILFSTEFWKIQQVNYNCEVIIEYLPILFFSWQNSTTV